MSGMSRPRRKPWTERDVTTCKGQCGDERSGKGHHEERWTVEHDKRDGSIPSLALCFMLLKMPLLETFFRNLKHDASEESNRRDWQGRLSNLHDGRCERIMARRGRIHPASLPCPLRPSSFRFLLRLALRFLGFPRALLCLAFSL